MYSKINDVNQSDFVIDEMDIRPDRNIIILDDMSITGQSQEHINDRFSRDLPLNTYLKSKIYHYSILSANTKPIKLNNNWHSLSYKQAPVLTYENNFGYDGSFSREEINSLFKFCSRYNSGMAAIAFPYIIPDNDSFIASYIYTPILYKSTPNSNKGMRYRNIP